MLSHLERMKGLISASARPKETRITEMTARDRGAALRCRAGHPFPDERRRHPTPGTAVLDTVPRSGRDRALRRYVRGGSRTQRVQRLRLSGSREFEREASRCETPRWVATRVTWPLYLSGSCCSGSSAGAKHSHAGKETARRGASRRPSQSIAVLGDDPRNHLAPLAEAGAATKAGDAHPSVGRPPRNGSTRNVG